MTIFSIPQHIEHIPVWLTKIFYWLRIIKVRPGVHQGNIGMMEHTNVRMMLYPNITAVIATTISSFFIGSSVLWAIAPVAAYCIIALVQKAYYQHAVEINEEYGKCFPSLNPNCWTRFK